MKSTPPTPPRGSTPLTPRSTGAQRPSAVKPAELERALALRDVMDHAVRVKKETPGARRLARSRTRMIAMLVACVVLLALSAYSWFARPEVIWGPRVHPSLLRQDAGARLAMALLAQRLDSYRETNGTYPTSLREIGEGASGVRFRLVGDSAFELRDSVGSREIVLRSGDRRDVFLGNSITTLGGHAR